MPGLFCCYMTLVRCYANITFKNTLKDDLQLTPVNSCSRSSVSKGLFFFPSKTRHPKTVEVISFFLFLSFSFSLLLFLFFLTFHFFLSFILYFHFIYLHLYLYVYTINFGLLVISLILFGAKRGEGWGV